MKVGDKVKFINYADPMNPYEYHIDGIIPNKEYIVHAVSAPPKTCRIGNAVWVWCSQVELVQSSPKIHTCNPVQMGFTISKMVCPTCDKEF